MAEEMKWTRGPWRAEQWGGGTNTKRLPRYAVVSDSADDRPGPFDDDSVVCIVEGHREADALLIAAAPDLYEALRDAVAALGGIHSDNVPESVRLALSRASPEQPK